SFLDYGEPETAEQKYNRLASEIDELAKQLQDENIEPSTGVNESSIAALADELKLLSLESRIRRIETLVGEVDAGRQPIADAVEDIRFRLDALNPSFVEGMETKLNSVISKLDQVEDKREKSVDGEMEAKVNDLLELMSKWDVACAAMPSNLKKLQGLHRLHEQAQHFSERLSQLVGVREQIEKAIAADRMAMCELQVKAKEDISALLGQVANLEETLKKLGK
ncbi:unnamed protein product, partial [Nippostrongylus brasiliensis]|uniref:Probable dynactin subunit 2 (inferred by orthology to a C. elegans protein) n=1 Tax=Nippostrongylus brasiliensis TaxID=27835 RepID=A0A0N4YYG8_NIPBR